MSKYTSPLYTLYHWLSQLPPKIRWSKKYAITEEDKVLLAEKLASGYYIILVGTRTHLSSYIVSLLSWIKTGKWAKYSHVLMNCDNITDPLKRDGFKFVEALAQGVTYSPFDEVFACDYACLMTPVNIKQEEWTARIDRLTSEVGTPYDDLFDLVDKSKLSCVEVVLDALKSENYAAEFANLDKMIKDVGNLVPQMYRDCPDFKVEIEL